MDPEFFWSVYCLVYIIFMMFSKQDKLVALLRKFGVWTSLLREKCSRG
jgi:hypothetical protein